MTSPIIDAIINIFYMAFLLSMGAGMGWLLWIRLIRNTVDGLEALVFAAATGLGVCGLCVLGIAALQWLTPLGLTVWITVAACAAIAGWCHFFRSANRLPLSMTIADPKRLWRSLVWTVLFTILLCALTPAIGNDALVYHLAVPKLYLKHHGLYFIKGNIFSQYPLLVEMFYTIALFVSNDIFAKLIHVGSLVILVGTMVAFSKRFFPQRAPGWLAALIMVSMPSVFMVGQQAYTDIFFSLFCFQALYAFMAWHSTDHRPWLNVSGICIGFAMSTKFAGLILPPMAVLGILIHARHRSAQWNRIAQWIGQIGIWIAITGLPFYLKNIWFTGNPLYPFFGGLFSTPGWSSDQARQYDILLKYLGMGREWSDYLLLPWNLSVHAAFNSPRFDGRVGPVFLVGLFCLGGVAVRHKPFRWASGFVGIYFVFWANAAQQIRYLLPILPILALAIQQVAETRFRIAGVNRTLGAMVLVCCLWNAPWLAENFRTTAPLRYLLGDEPRGAYLTRRIPSFPLFEYINQTLAAEDRVLLVYLKNRGFLLDRPYYSDSLFESYTLDQILSKASSPEAAVNAMGRMAITHLAVDRSYVDGTGSTLSDAGLLMYHRLQSGYLQEIFQLNDRYILYHIASP